MRTGTRCGGIAAWLGVWCLAALVSRERGDTERVATAARGWYVEFSVDFFSYFGFLKYIKK
jgi:hypothetical protein